jgi:hypothetical protein
MGGAREIRDSRVPPVSVAMQRRAPRGAEFTRPPALDAATRVPRRARAASLPPRRSRAASLPGGPDLGAPPGPGPGLGPGSGARSGSRVRPQPYGRRYARHPRAPVRAYVRIRQCREIAGTNGRYSYRSRRLRWHIPPLVKLGKRPCPLPANARPPAATSTAHRADVRDRRIGWAGTALGTGPLPPVGGRPGTAISGRIRDRIDPFGKHRGTAADRRNPTGSKALALHLSAYKLVEHKST